MEVRSLQKFRPIFLPLGEFITSFVSIACQKFAHTLVAHRWRPVFVRWIYPIKSLGGLGWWGEFCCSSDFWPAAGLGWTFRKKMGHLKMSCWRHVQVILKVKKDFQRWHTGRIELTAPRFIILGLNWWLGEIKTLNPTGPILAPTLIILIN